MGRLVEDDQRASRSSADMMTLAWSPESIRDLIALRAYIAEHDPASAKRLIPVRPSRDAPPYCLESDPNDKGDALGALANKLDLCRFSGPDVGQASGVFVDFDYRLIVRLGDQIPIFPAVGDALARVIDGGHLSTRDGASARR